MIQLEWTHHKETKIYLLDAQWIFNIINIVINRVIKQPNMAAPHEKPTSIEKAVKKSYLASSVTNKSKQCA